MPRFIHAADLHIDSPLIGLAAYEGAPVERIRGASRRALENLVELAIREQVRFVVLAGDVFDTAPLFETALFFRRQMLRLAEAGIPVAIVRGNHDYAGIAPQNFDMPARVRVLSHERPESWEICDGVLIHGRSYPRHDVSEDLVEGYPSPVAGLLNVGLLHTSLAGYPEHAPYAPTSQQVLEAMGYQYWALGHVHKRHHWSENGVHIVFPGNLQGRHIRETGAKGATLVEYEGNRIVSVEHLPLDVMRWHQVEVDVPAETSEDDLLGQVCAKVLEQTGDDRARNLLCAVRVSVTARSEPKRDLREFLTAELQSVGELVWLEKVRLNLVSSVDASAIDSHLRMLATELGAEPTASAELLGQLEKLKQQLRAGDPQLARMAEFLPKVEEDRFAAVERLLDHGLALIRAELR